MGVRGQTLSYLGSFSDPGTLDVHTTEWQIVDGGGGIVASGSDASISFTPSVTGTFTVNFTVTDDDGDSGTDSMVVAVHIAVVIPDPLDPTQTVLFVGGSLGRDKIDFKQANEPDMVEVKINEKTNKFQYKDQFGPMIERIVAYGQDGDDNIKMHGNLGPIPVEFYGGLGNDKLRGGERDDVLVGGPGHDLLHGKQGRDLLIGGEGSDKIIGHDGDDILIGGVYLHATNRAAHKAVIVEWTRTDMSYADRVAHLAGGGGLNGAFVLNDTTVLDDGLKDKLRGKKGLDWFLANEDDDKTDQDLEEMLTAIELEFVTLP